MPETITVEIAYGTAERQLLQTLAVRTGCTARQAVWQSRIAAEFPQADLNAPLGIFGKTVRDDTVLREGDRVELYRPLAADPKEARRRRIQTKQG
ncbi:MAG: RnfH family protein [Neisseria sp.]|nr:RnfH family protein [Neisseria sp.]